MKRVGHLYDKLVSDENLGKAIDEVNRTHHWRSKHRPNPTSAWVEITKQDRIKDLRRIIESGFVQKNPRIVERYDASARKIRMISEPKQWPDQYVHHALIQVLYPVFMRGMDAYCCGSIRNRGTHYGKRAIEKWLKNPKSTRYELSGDIRHFYDSLKTDVVMDRMKRLVKDFRVLDLIQRVLKDGVLIGAYTSQWFANVTLQPLDMLIRQSGLCSHYMRYMDNLTIFGPNKRSLKRLKVLIEIWLQNHQLELKGNWQIFPTRGVSQTGRTPDAVGYRYGRNKKGNVFVIPRKFNFLRLKRKVAVYHKKIRCGKPVHHTTAAGLLSRLGQVNNCNNCNIYKILYKGGKISRPLKRIVRTNQRKENLKWSTFLELIRGKKYSKQKAVDILP